MVKFIVLIRVLFKKICPCNCNCHGLCRCNSGCCLILTLLSLKVRHIYTTECVIQALISASMPSRSQTSNLTQTVTRIRSGSSA